MSDIASIYAVFGSQEEAETIARAMVERRLAACANILTPCTSIYRWEGKIERGKEVPTIFKTAADKADDLVAAIAETHSYDVPAICVWAVERGFREYADWVVAATEVRS